MKQLTKYAFLFGVGGLLYYSIETLWRGHSHTSMFILGGICFILIGLINEFFTYNIPLWKQQLISALIITVAELISGWILNVWIGLNVWDYSNLKFNLWGQISLLYSILWFFLALPAILIDDWLRHWLFQEEKSQYKVV